ncbi:uncharacterized protein LOC116662188 [Camelus ferus]|uniref:Uncharacterized protein LOC116662188 n=1 Tax=Camelus ferus TaxID=419612 RepID=A0A8B8SP56_CAMFR|nr:uncharacterized protein LOC116662188 [Camelus ferus]
MVRLTGTAGLGRPGATRPRPGAGSLEAGHLCGADPGGLPVGGGAPGPAAGPHGRACARLSPGVRTTKPRRWERGGGDVGGTLGRSRCAGDARRLRSRGRPEEAASPEKRVPPGSRMVAHSVSAQSRSRKNATPPTQVPHNCPRVPSWICTVHGFGYTSRIIIASYKEGSEAVPYATNTVDTRHHPRVQTRGPHNTKMSPKGTVDIREY